MYNLAFGDFNEKDGSLDDLSVSNNQDARKILSTVVSTLWIFMKEHPNAQVYAKGSTMARTRLYRMGISQNMNEISKEFAIFGYRQSDGWELFSSNRDYEGFIITRK